MPSKSDMSMQHNIQGMNDLSSGPSGMEGMYGPIGPIGHSGHQVEHMGGMMDPMDPMGIKESMSEYEAFGKSEHFTEHDKKDKKPVAKMTKEHFSNMLEGFEGNEYQAV
jgi:hypothetical protein